MRLELIHLRTTLLIVLLVFGQTVVMAHELGHTLYGADEYCSECLTQSVFAGSVTPNNHGFPVLETSAMVTPSATSSYSRNKLQTSAARAPPFSS